MRIRDLRSVRVEPLDIEVAEACTTLVGPNLVGKSSVIRALRAALDPSYTFDAGRDLPSGLEDPSPSVTCRFRGLPALHAAWRDGAWHVPDHPARGRVVWSAPSDDGVIGVIDRAMSGATSGPSAGRVPQGGVRDRALAHAIERVVRAVLPEVVRVHVDLAAATLEAIDVDGWPVDAGVGVRTAVALGTAHALAEWGVAPVAILLEEPGAFLHPAAQEVLRDLLGATAATTGASVLLTSASPFVIPRGDDDVVVALARGHRGATEVVGTAVGSEPQATLLGGLFRDRGLANVFDRVAALPTGTRGVVIVEGGTDKAYLELVVELLGREAVLDGVAVIDAGGAAAVALEAVILRAETDLPVLAILDNDQPGRQARDTLAKRLGFERRREVTTYAEVVPDHPLDTEAEDLFDWHLVARFVEERGQLAIRGKQILRADEWHFDLTSSAKSSFVGWVRRNAKVEHVHRWAQLLDRIDERLEPVDATVTPAAGPTARAKGATFDGGTVAARQGREQE